MIHLRSSIRKLTFFTSLILLLFFCNNLLSQNGQQLFSQNCASCHDPKFQRDLTGPNLAGVEDRWPDRNKLKEWIHNNQALIKAGYPYAVEVYNAHNKTPMNVFTNLGDNDIEALLAYIKTGPPQQAPAAGAAGAQESATAKSGEGDSTLLFGILTLILAIVAFVLLQVNANLKKLADEREGVPAQEPVPFWRNKVYIMFGTLVLFLLGGYYVVMGAIGLGRTQDYQPAQPVFYSHKVHAGVNQISCLYCHGGAQESKHANIPSVNVCMNCHLAINEYSGGTLYTAEGEEVNGTSEIQKLYKYAGFVAGKNWDANNAKPIEWVKVHNLPDHVYFNHSQHVTVGKVQCQTCHGEVTKMDEVKQFAPLSMGWCVNCHRESQVQFKDNGFYSIYEKYHQDFKNGTLDTAKGISVANIGGTECQKCHY